MLWWLLACTGSALDSGGEVVQWAEATAWTPGDPTEDPLASHRPEQDDCPAAAWEVEGEAFEVETGGCPYAWFVQALAQDAAPGALLQGELWHGLLDAQLPAQAHIAVLVDDEVAWEEQVDIPGAPALHTVQARLPEGAPAGARLGFHLHNHGDNSWSLGPLQLGADP